MPSLIRDANEIQRLCHQKQVIEAQLAKDFYGQFNSGAALQKIRDVVKLIIQSMTSGPDHPLFAAINEENKLRVWDKIQKSRNGLFFFMNAPMKFNTLDASDCSDIIRLAGCWVEKGGLAAAGFQGGGKDSWNERGTTSSMIKDAYRPGVQTGAGNWKQEVETVWADNKGKFKDLTARRDRGPGQAIEAEIKPYMRDPKAFSGMGGIPSNPNIGKRARGQSNVLKLDRLFGLIIGADISGTTTDTVFALEVWGGETLTAAYYLLPLATIVHNNHHALIEVALAMSLNGVINYDIGFYTTLLPKNCNLPEELVELGRILGAAERRQDNQHFLLYYNNGSQQPAGCFLFNQPEVQRLKAGGFWRGTRLLRRAPSLPIYPTLDTVRGLCAEFGIAIPA
jgi:hypothetical protein